MEECECICEECTSLGKHLRVGCPTQTLVTLRAVGRNRKVVRELSPICVRDKLVDRLITRCNLTALEVACDRCYGDRLYGLDCNLVSSCNRNKTVAEECAAGVIAHVAVALCKRVSQNHTSLGHTQILTVAATLGTVHTSALCTITVVEQLRRKASKCRTLLCLEYKRRNSSAVLTEVDNQSLASLNCHRLALRKLLGDNNLTVLVLLCVLNILPSISLYGSQREVFTKINLRTLRRKNLASELRIYLGCSKALGNLKSHLLASIILLAIEDCSVLHWTCYASLPILKVCSVQFLCAIGKSKLQNTTERRFLTIHTLLSASGYNLVSPPARRNLCRENIFGIGRSLERICNVIGK